MPGLLRRGALLSVLAACTRSGPATPAPLDALDAGASDSSSNLAPDAPPDTEHAAPGDAHADAGRPDAGVWCATQGLHLFCDDFDQGPLAQSWDQVQSQHGVPRLDGTAYTSPYDSFLAQTLSLSDGAVATVSMSKRVTYIATQMHLAYDVHVDALDPSAPVVISQLELVDALSDILEVVNVIVTATGASVDDFSTPLDGGAEWDEDHPLVPGPALGEWTRIRVDLDLPATADGGAGIGTLTVTVGASKTPSVDHVPMSPSAQPAQPWFYLGVVSASGPSPPVAVHFDDVTFDVEP